MVWEAELPQELDLNYGSCSQRKNGTAMNFTACRAKSKTHTSERKHDGKGDRKINICYSPINLKNEEIKRPTCLYYFI